MKIELDRFGRERGYTGLVRGHGTHLAFDCKTPRMADSLQRWMFRTGVMALKCGPKTIGLRPSMVLGTDDAATFRDNLYAYHPNFD